MKNAINAIEFSHGPCHTEVRLTKEGPKIVEINPRLGGRFISKMIEDSIGINPIKEVIKLAMGEQLELSRKPSTGSAWCAITSPKTGILKNILGTEKVLSSLGVEVLTINAKVGNRIKKPTNNGDAIGYIYNWEKLS
ncbi:hypothetical protein ACQKOF_07190 [Lysinibacillus sp. NPDC093190]|uniref:hypothetical protein n=1 Tax=Lysinibacillus sp. NPDC093190 TaxID=3390575 RepID=UPI003CFC51E5